MPTTYTLSPEQYDEYTRALKALRGQRYVGSVPDLAAGTYADQAQPSLSEQGVQRVLAGQRAEIAPEFQSQFDDVAQRYGPETIAGYGGDLAYTQRQAEQAARLATLAPAVSAAPATLIPLPADYDSPAYAQDRRSADQRLVEGLAADRASLAGTETINTLRGRQPGTIHFMAGGGSRPYETFPQTLEQYHEQTARNQQEALARQVANEGLYQQGQLKNQAEENRIALEDVKSQRELILAQIAKAGGGSAILPVPSNGIPISPEFQKPIVEAVQNELVNPGVPPGEFLLRNLRRGVMEGPQREQILGTLMATKGEDLRTLAGGGSETVMEALSRMSLFGQTAEAMARARSEAIHNYYPNADLPAYAPGWGQGYWDQLAGIQERGRRIQEFLGNYSGR